MISSRAFITGSRYYGSHKNSINCMEGFGTYTFIDDSVYRGYFQDGKFHGFGCIKMSAPNKFTIKGYFESGVLVSIEDIIFPDGLHVICGFNEDGEINFDNWDYLSEKDRRYSTEMVVGLEAVGPYAYLTRNAQTRLLRNGTYDVEEGIFHPNSGFITGIPQPFNTNRYVACAKEIQWINEYCRVADKIIGGTRHLITEPAAKFGAQIIKINIKSFLKIMQYPQCICNRRKIFLRHHLNSCNKKLTNGSSTDFDNESNDLSSSAEFTISSDCIQSLKDNPITSIIKNDPDVDKCKTKIHSHRSEVGQEGANFHIVHKETQMPNFRSLRLQLSSSHSERFILQRNSQNVLKIPEGSFN